MTLIPVDNDPHTATRTSTWDRRTRANSLVSTNVRQRQTLILTAVASLGAISGTLGIDRGVRCDEFAGHVGTRSTAIYAVTRDRSLPSEHIWTISMASTGETMAVNEKAWKDRCVPRIPLQASISYLTPEIMAKGLVIDVSREGLRIESRDPVHSGMRLALVLYLPNDQEPLMIEDATVQWTAGTHFGVKFVNWSSNAEARLTNFFWTGIQERCQSLLHLMTEAAKASALNESIDKKASSFNDDERDLIRRTLEESRWVISGASGAATKLGVKRTYLRYRMKKLGICRPTVSNGAVED